MTGQAAPAIEQTAEHSALAVVMPHRHNGVRPCGRWVFYCAPCAATTACIFFTPGGAGDVARWHLLEEHRDSILEFTAARAAP